MEDKWGLCIKLNNIKLVSLCNGEIYLIKKDLFVVKLMVFRVNDLCVQRGESVWLVLVECIEEKGLNCC